VVRVGAEVQKWVVVGLNNNAASRVGKRTPPNRRWAKGWGRQGPKTGPTKGFVNPKTQTPFSCPYSVDPSWAERGVRIP
jgi:hypothetical protein